MESVVELLKRLGSSSRLMDCEISGVECGLEVQGGRRWADSFSMPIGI